MSISLSLSVSESSVNQSANTSKVTVSVRLKSTYGAYSGYSSSGYVTIDGTKYIFSSTFGADKTTTLTTKSKTITHNADGSKSISIKASYSPGSPWGTVTASTTKTLTKISRQYKVILNFNGNGQANQTKTKTYGTNLVLPTPNAKSGYTFGGWCTTAAGGGTNYKTTYTANTAITLYAKWTPVTYKVNIYNYNGSILISQLSKTHGISLSLPKNFSTIAGYEFKGWSTSIKDMDTNPSADYNTGSYSTNKANNLYETFGPKQYTISYNAGSFVDSDGAEHTPTGNVPDSQPVQYKQSILIGTGNLTMPGYIASYWLGSDNKQYNLGETITYNLTSDLILTMQWLPEYVPPRLVEDYCYRVDTRGKQSIYGSNVVWAYRWSAAKDASGSSENVSFTVSPTYSEMIPFSSGTGSSGIWAWNSNTNPFYLPAEVTITITDTSDKTPPTDVTNTASLTLSLPEQVDGQLTSALTKFSLKRDEENLRQLVYNFIFATPYDGDNYYGTTGNFLITSLEITGKKVHFNTDLGVEEQGEEIFSELIDLTNIDTSNTDFLSVSGIIEDFTLDYILKDVKVKITVSGGGSVELQSTDSSIPGLIDMTGTVIEMGSISVHIPQDQRGISLFGFLRSEENGLVINNDATIKNNLIVNSDATIKNNLTVNKLLISKPKKSSWFLYGRDNAPLSWKQPIDSADIQEDPHIPILSTQAKDGNWLISTYDTETIRRNGLCFSFLSDTKYSSGINSPDCIITFDKQGQIHSENDVIITHGADLDRGFQVTGSEKSIRFTIGIGNNNRGVYDSTNANNRWILYAHDDSSTVTYSRGRPDQTAISHTTQLGNQVIVPPEWKFRANGKVLWTGTYYMTDGHQARFNTNARYFNGIVLAWSSYDVNNSVARDYGWQYYYIPKWHIDNYNGGGVRMELKPYNKNAAYTCVKYVYVYDDRILGNDENGDSGTNFDNRLMVLRAVIGV